MTFDWPTPSVRTLWAGGSLLLFGIYTIVFLAVWPDGSLAQTLGSAAGNVIPMAGLAVTTHTLLKNSVMPRSVAQQTAAHVVLAIAFALTWYALVILCQAFFRGLQGEGFAMLAFSRVAFVWQVFQGLMLYVAIAAVCYAIRGGREAANVTIVSTRPLTRYLTRTGDDIVPIDVEDIVTITGAQDYAEVATLGGKRHLVRMSLAEFEQRLDPARFLRIHRSTIVNFDHLARAEPAGGGRMLAHMGNGDTVQVSRAGAQTLRTLIV